MSIYDNVYDMYMYNQSYVGDGSDFCWVASVGKWLKDFDFNDLVI